MRSCKRGRQPRGSMVPAHQCCELAKRWYRGRLEPDCQRAGPERVEALVAEVGLTGAFWSLG